MHLLFTVLLCVGASLACNSALRPPHTIVNQGQLQGTWFTTRGGRRVAGFRGIPYAAPPVGPLRFKTAQHPSAWEGVFSATSDGPICLQYNVIARLPLMPDAYGSEDCLYLNVFSPSIDPSTTKLPVAVFIHGGYFEVGSSHSFLYGPQYLLDEDIVLVTFNYRLGILGFLSLNDPALPGNLGLKDQRAALRWVADNIAHFGGDPSAVTLFGESAGAACVHYHMMFTAKEGLFRAGICNSGSALGIWALHDADSQQPLVDLIVKHTGCPDKPALLVDCLRSLSAEQFPELLELIKETGSKLYERVTVIGPVVESVHGDVEDVLVTSDPWDTSCHLPLLLGANEMEGIYWLLNLEKDKTEKLFEELNANYTSILPFNLQFDHFPESTKVAISLIKFYFNTESISRTHFTKLIHLFSDGLFNYDLAEAAQRNQNQTFFYHMNYRGSNSIVHYLGSKSDYGVSHFDDMFYFFPMGGSLFRNVTATDLLVSKQMVKMWTNFIKYLDPTPDSYPVRWDPVSSAAIEYLDISQHCFQMRSRFLKERISVWKSFDFKTNKKKD